MLLFKNIRELTQYLGSFPQQGKSIGFVPTMGALHQGHISLIRQAAESNELVVCSIFINPTQFNQASDLEKYPKTIGNDVLLLEEAGCHVLFYPEAAEMYPEGLYAPPRNFGKLTTIYEGAFRPGHFDGVAEVVKRLFNIVQPNRAYFGLKDYQQCMVVQALVKEEKFPVDLVFCPTMREADGLAMSSRNRRLSQDDREKALIISKTLFWMKNHYSRLSIPELLKKAETELSNKLKVEYIDIVNAETLEQVTTPEQKAVALFAGWCGDVRLIDNMLLNE